MSTIERALRAAFPVKVRWPNGAVTLKFVEVDATSDSAIFDLVATGLGGAVLDIKEQDFDVAGVTEAGVSAAAQVAGRRLKKVRGPDLHGLMPQDFLPRAWRKR